MEWSQYVADAFRAGEAGDMDAALAGYSAADELGRNTLPGQPFFINPALSLLRHVAGHAEGALYPLPPTEDHVISMQLSSGSLWEAPDAYGMRWPDFGDMSGAIARWIDTFDGGYHAENIRGDIPHVQVLSTGRCGTMGLFHLLETAQYLPYHGYFINVAHQYRYDMAYRLMSGHLDNDGAAQMWCKCRAAEWIGAENLGRPMAMLNHYDTVFAPTLAALHPQAKFMYLRRDPVKVFESFFSKGQWSEQQISPIYYTFDPEFRWRHMRYDTPRAIAWYLRWTESFCAAFSDVRPLASFSSDLLFAGDRTETARLIDFLDLDMTVERVIQHYRTPYNEKRHKIDMTSGQIEAAKEAFVDTYTELGGVL